jgi:Flp pilus assembly protein TadG
VFNHLRNQRGATLAFTAAVMAALIALTVVGVDLGRLAFTATEVQQNADSAALAAVKPLVTGDQNWQVKGHTVAGQNSVDGQVVPDAHVLLEPGRWDYVNANFDLNGQPFNAARATTDATVTNFVAAAIGTGQTNVRKLAVAAYSGPASGCAPPPDSGCAPSDWACYCTHGAAPCLPIAAPDCQFSTAGQLPSLTVGPSGNDTAAWTGFQSGSSDNDVRAFLNQGPCDAPGSDQTPGNQGVSGSQVNVNNGISASCSSSNNVFGLMTCIYNNNLGCRDTNGDGIVDASGGTIFTIPIFHMPDCSTNMNQSWPLVGFATVNVTGACVGGVNRIDLQTIARNSTNPAPPGGDCFYTDCRPILAR